MLRLYKIQDGIVSEVRGQADELASQLPAAHWIDAHQPNDEERALLEEMLRTELPESDEMNEIEASSRCFMDEAGIHVHLLCLIQNADRNQTESVACILQKERLITIHENDFPEFRQLRTLAGRQLQAQAPQDFLVILMENKVENHADTLEDLHRQLELVGRMVLEDMQAQLDEAINRLARIEDSNGKVRLCLMDTERDISFLLRHLKTQPEQLETLRGIIHDIETLMSHNTFLFDKINFLMESTQGFISIKQNQIIKILSIAAVVFLPPTLVASIYGMNFEHMPELQWLLGYPWAVGLMIVSGILPFLYFKRKRWL